LLCLRMVDDSALHWTEMGEVSEWVGKTDKRAGVSEWCGGGE